MKNLSKNFTVMALLICGAALLLFAALISHDDYARILQIEKHLGWGAYLFRALLAFHGAALVGAAIRILKAKSEYPSGEQAVSPAGGEKFLSLPVLLGLLALTVAATALRLPNLDSDLWVDEVYTLLDFVRQPFGQIVTSFQSQNQHMLFSLLARASIETFGESAWSLRLPSVAFGAASVWALFFLARSIFDTRKAFLACALMTASYHHVWFSQNARGYMGLLFFTLLATWFWSEALRNNRVFWWTAYAAAIVLGMWIHMTMAFVVAAHGITHLALLAFPKLSGDENRFSLERRAGWQPFVAWAFSVTATLQLYALALPEFLRSALHEESRNSEWTNPLWVITESVQNLSIGFAGLAVVSFGGALVAFGWLKLFARDRRMALWMTLPPVLAGAFMFAAGHNLFPRFFFFAMGFGLLIAVNGAAELPEFIAGKLGVSGRRTQNLPAYAGTLLVVLMIAASLVTVPRNYRMPKQDFTGAKQFVENARQPNGKIVAVSIAGEMYGRYFAPHWTKAETILDLESIERSSGDIWLIYTLSPEIKAFHPQMWQTIERDYETVKAFPGTLNGGEVFICRRRGFKEQNNETNRIISQK